MSIGITWTHLESVWNPSGPSVTGQELFFAVSYSIPALNSPKLVQQCMVHICIHIYSPMISLDFFLINCQIDRVQILKQILASLCIGATETYCIMHRAYTIMTL